VTDYQMEQHWSNVGERVDDRAGENLLAGDDSPYYRYKADLFSQKFRPLIPVSGRAVLDVGCGPGGTLGWMAEQKPRRLVGCDQSSRMVALATQNVPEAEVVQVDGESLPFSNEEFDVVTTVTVLQHNPDDRRAAVLREICRVSNSDILLFEDIAKYMPVRRTSGGGTYNNFYGRPVGWYAGVCSAYGFDLVETRYLETYVSRRVELFLSAHLNSRGRTEGSAISRWHRDLERLTIPVTRRLDEVVKAVDGEIALMWFKRRNPEPRSH
jgi:SAM-dependent methyltransferase